MGVLRGRTMEQCARAGYTIALTKSTSSNGLMKVNTGILIASGVMLVLACALVLAQREPVSTTVTVYKTPTCGCCAKWVTHLEEEGFDVETHDMDNLSAIKSQYGIDRSVASCHTAVVDGYVVEGHVPAEHVKQLLRDRPAVTGIAVPGMPIGSPGMEGPNARPYDVVSFDDKGKTALFARVTP